MKYHLSYTVSWGNLFQKFEIKQLTLSYLRKCLPFRHNFVKILLIQAPVTAISYIPSSLGVNKKVSSVIFSCQFSPLGVRFPLQLSTPMDIGHTESSVY